MDKQKFLRILRRTVTVLAVLVMLVACSAQVRAEDEQNTDPAALAAEVLEETGLTAENFSAIAVQLEAVARADGRLSADRMLYAAFQEAAALQVSEAVPAAAVESGVNVIVVPEKRSAPTAGQLLPFLAVVAAAGVMLFAVRRKNVRGTVYKPMRTRAAGTNPYAGYGMVRTYR